MHKEAETKKIGNVQSIVRGHKDSLILKALIIAYDTHTLLTVRYITTTKVNVDTSIAESLVAPTTALPKTICSEVPAVAVAAFITCTSKGTQ